MITKTEEVTITALHVRHRNSVTYLETPRVLLADTSSTSGLFSACLLSCRHLWCLPFLILFEAQLGAAVLLAEVTYFYFCFAYPFLGLLFSVNAEAALAETPW